MSHLSFTPHAHRWFAPRQSDPSLPASPMAKRQPHKPGQTPEENGPKGVRIIGGTMRGRTIEYSGDPRTRPMKDRTREAVYNLVGPSVKGTHAIDLFAGTGALGLEALSRGAERATFIERHIPTAKLIRDNIAKLGVTEQCEVTMLSAFVWGKKHAPLDPERPWLVLCSPPFSFYVERREEMLDLINRLWKEAPADSVFVLESDTNYDFGGIPTEAEWDIRRYAPAMVGIARKG